MKVGRVLAVENINNPQNILGARKTFAIIIIVVQLYVRKLNKMVSWARRNTLMIVPFKKHTHTDNNPSLSLQEEFLRVCWKCSKPLLQILGLILSFSFSITFSCSFVITFSHSFSGLIIIYLFLFQDLIGSIRTTPQPERFSFLLCPQLMYAVYS